MAVATALSLYFALAQWQTVLEPILVTGSHNQTPRFDIPASITSVDGDTLRSGKLQINLSESLARVPGINVQNRGNYAQDLQISSRGYGARASFGVRGIKLLVDGIPASAPDGAGQVGSFPIASAAAIDVLRGPFSALYGNASGGVIQLFTKPPPTKAEASASAAFAPDQTQRISVQGGLPTGELGGIAFNASRFATDGFRPHSSARRELINAKGEWQSGDHQLLLSAHQLDLPEAKDALGLTQAQLAENPDQTSTLAAQFNTRKSSRQNQLGGTWRWQVAPDFSLSAMSYLGSRDVQQFQAIAPAVQRASTHPGGVIDLARNVRGGELRASTFRPLAGSQLRLSVGATYDRQHEDRLGFENFRQQDALQVLGVRGTLRRDERNTLKSNDLFAQADWQGDALNLFLGARQSNLRMLSQDRFINANNPDDSGRLKFSATTPVFGALFKLSPDWRIYASTGSGFESPSLNEVAYSTSGQSGLNAKLKSARSQNVETGIKWRNSAGASASFALFRARTQDEIAALSNSGGRSVFRNVSRSLREGLEASYTLAISEDVDFYASASQIRARYLDGFLACGAPPCNTPNVPISAGARIPGVPKAQFFAELQARPTAGLTATLEVQHQGRVYANDSNSESAKPATLLGAMLSYQARRGDIDWTSSLRVENISNQRDAGSVIVNEANARFFEPRAPRTWLFSIEGSWR